MIELFRSIKSFVKIPKTLIDNHFFRFHYKYTALLFASCSILITAKQFFGDPIDCIVDKIDQKVIDSFCWIHSTYTIPKFNNGTVGRDVAHPGVIGPRRDWTSDDVKHHKYYQWVCFVLFLQGEEISLIS